MTIYLQCVECAKKHRRDEAAYTCPGCGGNLKVLYDYDEIRLRFNRETLAASRDFSMWRYRALLPVEPASFAPPLAVGWTPLYDCARLAATFGLRQLWLKDEGRNPTASLKDRPSALAVVKALETGARVVTTASSGNAGSALAGMCASVGLRAVVFVPADTPPAKLVQMQVYGATVLTVEGSYDEAYDLCLAAGRRFGWYQRSTGYNPYMAEGKKTAALEVVEQMSWAVPDKVFVSVGDGCIIGGLWKGFDELHRLGFVDKRPQMFGVQAETAAVVVDALQSGKVEPQAGAATVADSICVGQPRDATNALRAMRESGGDGIKVSDEEIIVSVGRLARATGVFAEPAAAAAFAGFVKLCESGLVKSDERVLVMLTGNGLKSVEPLRRALGEPLRVKPDLDEVARRLAAAAPETLAAESRHIS
jgi:threonine synthase